MTSEIYDTVIFNGQVVTASTILPPSLYIGISNGIISTISTHPLQGKSLFDAEGAYITPGGIDAHVHLEEVNNFWHDNFETATKSAISGGTTSIITFIQQENTNDLNLNLFQMIKRVENISKNNSYCDYGFHLILTNINSNLLKNELPKLVKEKGITSIKIFTTYESLKLSDYDILKIMLTNRKLGILTMIHAENNDIIEFLIEKLESKKLTDPFYHTISKPIITEDEASYRVISLSKIIDTPILIVHMSTIDSLNHVADAQKKCLPIYSETCPQYLFLTSDYLKGCRHNDNCNTAADKFEGAKYVCSPPLRQTNDELNGVWNAIKNGTVTIFSSDHAPCIYDDSKIGKKIGLINGIPHFNKIPNGMPGIETRCPLLWCYGVETNKISPSKYVEVTSTNPSKIYGMDSKGSIEVGKDADIIIWYPQGKMKPFKLSNDMLHHQYDYTPYEGMNFNNWPRYTFVRGKLVWDRDKDGIVSIDDKSGVYIKRSVCKMPGSTGPLNPILE